MRLRYILSEMVTGLWRNVTMTVAMIITMTISLTMLGASLLLYREVENIRQLYYGDVEVSVFLKIDATEQQRRDVEAALRADGLVKRVRYESRQEAYTRFRALFSKTPDLVQATNPNVFQASLRIKLNDPKQAKTLAGRYRGRPGVDTVVDEWQYLSKLFQALGAIRNVALTVAIVQGVAALLLVACTIQVAAYSKRREVAVMKLVGAANWLIQVPFVLEAVFAGVLGAVLAFLALAAAKVLLIDGALEPLTRLFPALSWHDVLSQLPLLAGVATAVSGATGWVTLRRHLRV